MERRALSLRVSTRSFSLRWVTAAVNVLDVYKRQQLEQLGAPPVLPELLKSENGLILVTGGDDLAWLIDVRIKEDDSLQIGFLPADLLVPIACAQGYAAPLSNVKMETNRECITESVGNFLHVDYDHSIYLHMKTFSRDVGLTLPDTGLKTSGELVDFMHKASDKLEMSMLFHYKNYITSDLSAMDYIRYYRRLHGKKLSITYAYMNYMDMEDASIPMDNQLHVRKK